MVILTVTVSKGLDFEESLGISCCSAAVDSLSLSWEVDDMDVWHNCMRCLPFIRHRGNVGDVAHYVGVANLVEEKVDCLFLRSDASDLHHGLRQGLHLVVEDSVFLAQEWSCCEIRSTFVKTCSIITK